MTREESTRRWFTLVVGGVAMCSGSYLGATTWDEKERVALIFMLAVLALSECVVRVWLAREKKGRVPLPVTMIAAAMLVLVAVKCGHELVGRYWVAVASREGESDAQWIDRMSDNWKERALTRGQSQAELHHN